MGSPKKRVFTKTVASHFLASKLQIKSLFEFLKHHKGILIYQGYFTTLWRYFQGLFIFLCQVLTIVLFSAIIIMCKAFASACSIMHEMQNAVMQYQTCHGVAERRIYGKTKLEGLAIHTARNRLSRNILSLSPDRRFHLFLRGGLQLCLGNVLWSWYLQLPLRAERPILYSGDQKHLYSGAYNGSCFYPSCIAYFPRAILYQEAQKYVPDYILPALRY